MAMHNGIYIEDRPEHTHNFIDPMIRLITAPTGVGRNTELIPDPTDDEHAVENGYLDQK